MARKIGMAVGLFLLGAAGFLSAQNPPPATSEETPKRGAGETPDHARAYYHYMLARRYKELATINNSSDYVERAISEYKQAMEADPGSLFLRVELADLYWHVSRIGDAIREAEAVLEVNPDQADAHRLLGHIYLRNLNEVQADKAAKENLRKALEQFEALTRLDPSDADSWVILGRLYKVNNEGAKAEEAFKKALSGDPTSRNALVSLAQLYSDQGDYTQAIELLTKIPESDLDGPLLATLAEAYYQNHDLDRSVATFEKALNRDPDNLDIHRRYAEVLISSGKTAAARAELQKILKADPEEGSAYLQLGQLDREEGQFDQARKELDRAATLTPEDPKVPYQQALLEDAAGNEDRALQILEGLLKQSESPHGQYSAGEANNRAIFLERLGLIYRTQEKYDQALGAFRQILALGESQAARGEGLIIETLRLSRQPEKAMEEADAALKKYPGDRSLLILHASLLGEQGKLEQALEQLNSLLKGTPADRETYLSIAQIDSQAKRFPQAEAAIQQAMGLSPKPEDKEYVLFLLGSVYEREKKYELAEEQFKKVLAADPLNAAASNYLGYMLADRGVRLEESVKLIQKALQIEPNNGAYLDSLGWAYFKMNRLDLAEIDLGKAARLIRNDPTIHEHLGRVYLQMGKEAQAEQEWERALQDWPQALGSDFDADQAAKLQKELGELKSRLAKERAAKH